MSLEGGGHSVAVRHLADCVRAKVYTGVCDRLWLYISIGLESYVLNVGHRTFSCVFTTSRNTRIITLYILVQKKGMTVMFNV